MNCVHCGKELEYPEVAEMISEQTTLTPCQADLLYEEGAVPPGIDPSWYLPRNIIELGKQGQSPEVILQKLKEGANI
jgi:hypothetical protein